MGYDFRTGDEEVMVDANTPEQRKAALNVVAKHADVASFGELVAMLGLAR
jgi:hypothetical protein